MEVVEAGAGLLTDGEVYQLLQQVRADEREQGKKGTKHLSTLLYEASEYLKQTAAATQTAEQVGALAEAVASMGLTRAELLQLLNLRPTTPVEIQLIVEECEERLSEEQVDRLLELIVDTLPAPPQSAAQADGAAPAETSAS